ncbi:hypothetical protein ACFQQB_63810 [Nonomuraea rubra]|uniref:hypothetical protein n=1 Tax=Nonomuraea rubra TaxID=46180 RepID=UPI003613009D
MHEQRQRADALRNADRIVRAAIAILRERGPEVSSTRSPGRRASGAPPSTGASATATA